MSIHKINGIIFAVVSLLTCSQIVNASRPSEQTLTIGNYSQSNQPPYFYGTMDAAGFSDAIYWGNDSNHHPHSYHEVLSGEWGSFAIYYNGIATEPNAMFLTNQFLYPDWNPENDFYSYGASAWNDANNPVSNNNTGQSIIENEQVRVTVDYEVVDLGDGNWSPLNITDANGNIGFVRSFQYLFLQTYTVKNIKTTGNLTNLELYGMLHSHAANEYGDCVHASYTAANYNDPLSGYTPYNSVHNVGNFKYDFAQWNNLAEAETADHVDWVGFSCTVEPNVYDCNFYEDGHTYYYFEPPEGTHQHIQKRNLNNVNYAYGQTAGAMGWYLPDLAPGQSTSITVAFMFGYGPIDYNQPYDVDLSLTDDVAYCVYPNNDVNFTVSYAANQDINDVNLVVSLSPFVQLNYFTGGGYFDHINRTITWNLGDRTIGDFNGLPIPDSNTYTINCTVNPDAPEGWYMQSYARLYAGQDLAEDACPCF